MNPSKKTPHPIVWLAWGIIAFNIILAAWYVLHSDIVFHTDIARDFVFMHEIVTNQDLVLIGPRVGGISGMFHGPAWLYLNLPAFIIGQGNPVIVGWWWVILELLFLVSVYVVTSKLFNKNTALLTTALTSTTSALGTSQFFNPSGAEIIFPIFFYLFWVYLTKHSFRHLVIALVLVGFMVQFQFAFGIPILLLSLLLFFAKVIRQSRWKDLLALAFLLLPFSTYLIFELRHDFLQLRSALAYFRGDGPMLALPFSAILQNRLYNVFFGIGIVSAGAIVAKSIVCSIFLVTIFLGLRSRHYSKLFAYYLYFYVGYWVLSLFIKEEIKDYYFGPLVHLNFIMFASILNFVKKEFVLAVAAIIVLLNTNQAKITAYTTSSYTGNHESSWQYNYQLAQHIVDQAPAEFSYYVMDTDVFGYSIKYAMLYALKESDKLGNKGDKKSETTYLIIGDKDALQQYVDLRWWKEDQLKITSEPVNTEVFRGLHTIQEYKLSSEEINTPLDPNIINNSLLFR